MSNKISLILVNYHSARYLKDCLNSLSNDPAIGEIIIVDNASGENLAPYTQHTRVVYLEKNVGFGAACNQGAREAKEPFLLFLNPDTQLKQGNLQTLVDELNKNTHFGIVGPKLLNESGESEKWSYGKTLTLWRILRNHVLPKRSPQDDRTKAVEKVDWISGAAILVRKKDFLDKRGFDEKFFMYFEDMDLCLRWKKDGLATLRVPMVQFKHFNGGSFGNKKHLQKKYYYQSQEYYFQKHRPYWEQKFLSWLKQLFLSR